MNRDEARHRVVSALLQAGGPATPRELVDPGEVPTKVVSTILAELVAQGQVIQGRLTRGVPDVQVRWAARWQEQARDRAARHRRELTSRVAQSDPEPPPRPDIESPPAKAFVEYVIQEYAPPPDKRILVFFQCSVRRPFSSSPSHSAMRRAIRVATGLGPSEDFELCPVHVVVLASALGPVPYELEDVYPANVRDAGVKSYRPDRYDRVMPILADRLGRYMAAHRGCYDTVAAFGQGRYAEVLSEAGRVSASLYGAPVRMAVFPRPGGVRVVRAGRSTPRKYWEKCWIQLCLHVADVMGPDARKNAEARLAEMAVEYAAP